MAQSNVLNDLWNAIADTTSLFGDRRKPRRNSGEAMVGMIEAILAGRGEASSSEHGATFLRAFRDLDHAGRSFVFRKLGSDYGPDAAALSEAARAYLEKPDEFTAKALQKAAEPRRVEVFRRLNHVQGGTEALVALRLELMSRLKSQPDLYVVDDDLKRLFNAWFNRGFLILREINWETSAAILEKILRYESVHAINGWDDLRLRIDVPDRLLFGFFHPRLRNEPLIFVEVALTTEMPTAIAPILAGEREHVSPREATTAVFYSINNCQDGLRGISFGSFLIKQVAGDLMRALPNLKTFVTLSPVPGFTAFLERARKDGSRLLSKEARGVLERIDKTPGWPQDEALAREADAALTPLLAHYLLNERDARGRLADPVARFHLGNGARLEQLNFDADRSARSLSNALGYMVNYRYVLDEVEKNHEAFVNEGRIAASSAVTRLARQVKAEPREPAQGAQTAPAPASS